MHTHILVHVPHKHVHTAYTCAYSAFTFVNEMKSQTYLQKRSPGFSLEIEIKIAGVEENRKVLLSLYLFILVTGCGFSVLLCFVLH